MSYASAVAIRRDIAELLRPPRRISVSQATAENLRVVDGGGNASRWNPDTTPYMQQAMDCLSSRQYDAVIFIGPSRSGKTSALVEGLQCYCRTCDPGDMLITQITEDKAREYSKIRIDRQLRNSPEMAKRISTRAHDDNVHDKLFKDGSLLSIKWPTKNTFASSDYRYVALTDYDRLPADIGGEGDPFSLASKRTQTFLSRGMTLVETSPGVPFDDLDWRAPDDEPHRAPPVRGGMALYNQGDRRRLYWPCLTCHDWYQPTKDNWNDETAHPQCPHCGAEPEESQKKTLNKMSVWLPEGCEIIDGNVEGTRRKTRIASFWMEGPAAAYQTWASLSAKLLDAETIFEQTGSQETLQAVMNTDWGRPYVHRRLRNARSSERLADRATIVDKKRVPEGVRFLTATVDVQGGKDSRFVCQIHGWGVGRERWVVDRFNIKEDKGPDGKQPPTPIWPATNPEDWDVLTRDLLPRTYAVAGHPAWQMPIMMVGIDTGGEQGVTPQAYSWYRRLLRAGMSRRVMLLKGATHKQMTRIRPTNPNSKSGKNNTDITLYLLATDELKDEVAAQLDREAPGPNFLHTPQWIGRWWYDELTAEERHEDGKWRKHGKKPNEAFDLLAYDLAVYSHLGGDKIDWDNPPDWAKPWAANPVLKDSTLLVSPTRNTRVRRRASHYLGR